MVLIGEFFTAHDGGNQLRIYSRGDCSAEANSGMIIELLKDMVYKLSLQSSVPLITLVLSQILYEKLPMVTSDFTKGLIST